MTRVACGAMMLALAAGAAGCEPDGCTVGASVGCVCTSGAMGAQVCLADQTLGPCMCDDDRDAGGGTDAGGPTDAGADVDSGAPGDDASAGDDAGTPSSGILDIVAGFQTVCIVRDDGEGWCWGHGFGEEPARVEGAGPIASIGVGNEHWCFVERSGAIGCWGDNSTRQLGVPDPLMSPTPLSPAGVGDASAITGGWSHTCALSDGAITCWGGNQWGEAATTPSRDSGPNRVGTITDAVEIAAGGGGHTCARLASGAVGCWGNNSRGQLGSGSEMFSAAPLAVVGLDDAVDIDVSSGHSCAARADGTVVQWGRGSALVSAVRGVSAAVAVGCGESHACAVIEDGTVQCWGGNFYGQLGDGTTTDRDDAGPVPDLDDAVAIAVGFNFACAVRATGAVVCWGQNMEGQIGDGTRVDRRRPTAVVFP